MLISSNKLIVSNVSQHSTFRGLTKYGPDYIKIFRNSFIFTLLPHFQQESATVRREQSVLSRDDSLHTADSYFMPGGAREPMNCRKARLADKLRNDFRVTS